MVVICLIFFSNILNEFLIENMTACFFHISILNNRLSMYQLSTAFIVSWHFDNSSFICSQSVVIICTEKYPTHNFFLFKKSMAVCVLCSENCSGDISKFTPNHGDFIKKTLNIVVFVFFIDYKQNHVVNKLLIRFVFMSGWTWQRFNDLHELWNFHSQIPAVWN